MYLWIFSCIINPESTGCGFGTVISPYLFGATASLFDVMVFLHRYIPDQMSGSRLLYNRSDRRQRNHLTDMIYHLPDRQYCGGLILLKMGKVMKKIICTTLYLLLPCYAFATDAIDTTDLTDDSSGGLYTYHYSYELNIDKRFFIEYGVSIFSSVGTKEKLDGETLSDVDTTSINTGTSLSIGADFNGIQLAFTPSYSYQEETSLFDMKIKLDVPFLDTKLQPYVSLSAGIGFISIDSLDVDNEIGFSYGIGAGIKYSFNDNTYVKVGLEYASTSLDFVVYGYGANISESGFGLTTGLGYRF